MVPSSYMTHCSINYLCLGSNTTDNNVKTKPLLSMFGKSPKSNLTHTQLTCKRNLECLKKILSEYNDDDENTSNARHYMLCYCDVTTPLIECIIACLTSTSCQLYDIERKMSYLPSVTETHMKVVACAKNIQLQTVQKQFISVSMTGHSLSESLSAFSSEDDDSSSRSRHQVDVVELAAREAVNKAQSSKAKQAWKRLARIPKPVTKCLQLNIYILAIIRVLKSIKYSDFINFVATVLDINERAELENHTKFCNRIAGVESIDEWDLGRVVEKVIQVAICGDVEEDQIAAMELSKLFMKHLVHKHWKPVFVRVEAVSIDVLFDSLTDEEISDLVSKQKNSFFFGTRVGTDGKKEDDPYDYRRRTGLRVFFYTLLSRLVAKSLEGYGLHKIDASNFSFAVLCSPSSSFISSEYDFFRNRQLYQASPTLDAKTKASIFKTVKSMFKKTGDAMHSFRNDSMFVDLTSDMPGKEKIVLDHFRRFFGLDED